MELSQGQIIKKSNKQELSSFFTTHRLDVLHAPESFINIFHTVKELWPRHGLLYGTKSGTDNSKTKQASIVFFFHDTSSQCHACTCKVS